jgi:hypothetical protein
MFGRARLLATRPCAGPGFRDRQSSEAGSRRGFLFRTGAPFDILTLALTPGSR